MSAARAGGATLLLLLLTAVVAVGAGAPAPASAQQPTWRLEQPEPPAGSRFQVPLGRPGDLQCFAVDRCLMAVEGNATVPQGLYFYDGVRWKQYTTVCGGPAATTRIAWAGPTDFWTVTTPSSPRRGGGLGLCHIKDGQVVGSFSTPNESADPFRTMSSASCRTPDDCVFGGVGSRDPAGQRVGAFHVRWDGTTLTTLYGPQGRGVSDVLAVGPGYFETSFIGVGSEERSTEPSLAAPEDPPITLRTLTGTSFRNAPFAPRGRANVPPEGTELLAADSAGGELWFAGGGAASGTAAPRDTSQPRPPIAVRRNGGFFSEIPFEDDRFGPTDRFVDLAVLPGRDAAWVAAQPYADRGSTTAKATVARLSAGGDAEVLRLPLSGAGRGSAAKIECPAPEECWMLTTAGWLFHLTDGAARAALQDPAFANLIDFRPNEASAQFVPDTPPADDSRLFAPPPTETPAAAMAPTTAPAQTLRALIFKVTRPKVSKRLVLSLSFTMRRRGRVQLQARRKGRIVARSSSKVMRPGRKTVRLKLTRKRYPDELVFLTAEGGGKLSRGGSGGGSTGTDDTSQPGDTATTGGDTAATPGADTPATGTDATPGSGGTTTGPGNETVGTGPGNETVGTRAAR